MEGRIFMKILAIAGSHRKAACYKALEIIRENLDLNCEFEIFSLHDKEIGYCKVCNGCKKTGKCILKDDFGELEAKLKEADIIIVASPVYFGSVSAKLKSVFDRSRSLRVNWDLENKVCIPIAVGATKHGGQEHTVQAITAWASIHSMLVAFDGSPTAHFGGMIQSDRKEPEKLDDWGRETLKTIADKIKNLVEKFKLL